ncbi:hypothetical protein N825_06895 [Skermanella stibiiresistens SB22]|uniref:Uncharacterized protein n=1 Tax=Skermanella stibiiresistens SB22 TaxID=1385369 RepID=W9H450_9PROT|nr:hypothetical protein [Skermanella stibiiresistens]EWY39497.1 hypothetical protein N825_06895 [Skermanella stibiiresistens SB22]
MGTNTRQREELAQRLYEESDRTGVAWVRRPESVKHAFREAAERRLRTRGETADDADPEKPGQDADRAERERHGMAITQHTGGPRRGKPVMEPCTL